MTDSFLMATRFNSLDLEQTPWPSRLAIVLKIWLETSGESLNSLRTRLNVQNLNFLSRQHSRLRGYGVRAVEALPDDEVRRDRVLYGRQPGDQVPGRSQAIQEGRSRNFCLPGIRRKRVSCLDYF